MQSWYTIRARGEGAELSIHDEIGAYGVSAKSFLAELGALASEMPLEVHLNSPGGSVFDAVAIHNGLKRHEGTVTVWIDGIAASAASYVAMAGDEVVMPGNAFLMIHDPSGMVLGTAADMRATADALDRIAGSLVRGYAAKSGRSDEEIVALMAKETWLDAAEAVELGFADRMVEPVRLAARFDIRRFRNAPQELAEAVEADVDAGDETNGTDTVAAKTTGETGESDQVPDAEDEETAVPDAQEPQAETPPPSGAQPDPAAIRTEAIAHARAVLDLCRLAGQPQMAGRFLEQDASLDQVRAALLAAKAEAEPEIAPHHPQPGHGSEVRPWSDVIARTFKLKG